MAAAVDVGNGTTITYGTTAFAGVITGPVSWVQDIAEVDTSNMSTTLAKTYILDDLKEPGELSYSGHFHGGLAFPILGTSVFETITVDWAGQGVGAKWAASGRVKHCEVTAGMGAMMTYNVVIKISGSLTLS